MRLQLGAVEAWNKRICHLNGGGGEGQRRADLGSGWKRYDSVPKEHRRPDVLTRPGRKSFADIGQRLKIKKAKGRSTMEDQGGAVPPVLAAAGAEAKCSACLVLLLSRSRVTFSFSHFNFQENMSTRNKQMADQ